MKPNFKSSILLLVLVLSNFLHASAYQGTPRNYPIIPYPVSLQSKPGNFTIKPTTKIILPSSGRFKNEAAILNGYVKNCLGTTLKIGATPASLAVRLVYDASITAEEGYGMVVSPAEIVISTKTNTGMFRAIQTIRQLLPVSAERKGANSMKSVNLPALIIKDEPAYAWRGMHLDVSRHFFSLAYLEKFIDVMALYKFNKFHLHLTDDQGWRIEIKKYPKLTENGAWRTLNNQDSVCLKRAVENPDFNLPTAHFIQKEGKTLYGGFYTQKEMKALVAYAQAKHIEIIPEIDMPGHMMAAINEYPYLSCDGKSGFGKTFSTPICPCLPSTFQFAQDVYSEIMDIFPSNYLHVGGDEVDRSGWAKSDACKALMESKGLKTTAELQSYFINEMERFFNAKGRKLIGWDEVLEDGISKTAVIMYWRSWVPDAPKKAALNGNKVIMTPGNPLYFDTNPDKNSISNVYHFNLVPQGLMAGEGKNIIGAQANIWTEYIPSERRADYMYMPRMTALAEVLWANGKNYPDYLKRLQSQYGRLDALNVHYRLPDLTGFLESNVFTDQDTLKVHRPLPGLTVRYTTDGSLPLANSTILKEPLVVSDSRFFRLAAFRTDGSRGDIYDLKYQKQTFAAPERVENVKAGLVCKQYAKYYKSVALIPDTQPDKEIIVNSFVVPKALEAESFGLKYRGYLEIPNDGIYSFYLTCDDGGVLKIADREVVNNDGLHSAIEKNGQVALKKGLQKVELDFIEGGGGYALQLKYSLNGGQPQDIPSAWLKN